jgi:hypothetical protein
VNDVTSLFRSLGSRKCPNFLALSEPAFAHPPSATLNCQLNLQQSRFHPLCQAGLSLRNSQADSLQRLGSE